MSDGSRPIISHRDGYDAIRRFAGADPGRAVYYPGVTHYEVFE